LWRGWRLLHAQRRPVEVIDWADVGYPGDRRGHRAIEIIARKTARLHPVEIARLAEAFSYQHGAEIVESSGR
jgi:hypothetical protein